MSFSGDKVLGMLWGLHAGDCLGAPLEFLQASPYWNYHTEIIGGGKFNWQVGEATDDTDLMLCVLKSVQGASLFSFDILKKEMLSWYHSNPPDIGNTTIKGLRQLAAGVPLKDCGFVDEQFQGNGSIMRVAPLSLLKLDANAYYESTEINDFDEIIETQTKMTHGHTVCVAVDKVFLVALRSVLAGDEKNRVFDLTLKKAQEVSGVVYERLLKIPALEWGAVATSGYCVDTLCAAMWTFLKYDNFEDSVVAIVNRGDDSDSCGAVAGALCGAYYGANAIPQRWLQKLELREEIAKQLKI